ncbi:YhcH/YjgK/YiaL family protein [Flavobacterium capsici]|uniref:YhcH/YjgK/YiaL family protein n=1 Tax=Flavobacterium capsici TaxID=3075618 RepID=A0AA96JAP6_9FLAO|nr:MULTISPECIES: YhcH/YjgK/YiaL family protein [unclassified Flavobacterium]WNM17741.1 YhcH/YjgK/YiaL family protein [Flavobacterium sp. PMR2A8]WNM21794.1 YhcH/YjgK/YiaL family protein [Flavobacterium sp. PMTSA4]
MIVDTLNNGLKYSSLHPLFATAFEYLQDKDLNSLEDGKHDIAEGLKLIVSNGNGKTAETSLEKFECHDQNIDIQICVNGLETIGWKPREKCNIPNGEYNDEKDVRFFNDEPDMFFQLTNNQFVIFYPEDVHAPMIGDGAIKKLVFKVKI